MTKPLQTDTIYMSARNQYFLLFLTRAINLWQSFLCPLTIIVGKADIFTCIDASKGQHSSVKQSEIFSLGCYCGILIQMVTLRRQWSSSRCQQGRGANIGGCQQGRGVLIGKCPLGVKMLNGGLSIQRQTSKQVLLTEVLKLYRNAGTWTVK